MASSRPWPFDDEDRPSGSVRPLNHADLQAILAHLADDEPDLLLADTDADRPVVALRVRATVGRAGGSAQSTWQRMRTAELATWTQTLPWRIAVILVIGAAGGVIGSLLAPRPGLILGTLAAVVAGWGLAVPTQRRCHRLAARGGRGAAHGPPARPARATRVGSSARLGPPRQPG